MKFDEFEGSKAIDRQAYSIANLPDDLAMMLEAGLKELQVPLDETHEDGETIIR